MSKKCEISFIMMHDEMAFLLPVKKEYPERAHLSRKSEIEVLREAENHCRGAQQSIKEEDAHPPKHCTYTLTFNFYLFLSMLSEPTSLRGLGRNS